MEANKNTLLDIEMMKIALAEALKGSGTTSPNPMVGAVVCKSLEILGKGFHVRSGEPHAEPNAIANCNESVEGATLYVTLEPCCHVNKKTPPCTSLIIEKRISRVVIGTLDPNPNVAGNGVKILREAGIEVEVGVCEDEAKELITPFAKAITTELPFVHLKWAQTLDGKIATVSGDSKWISSEEARKEVHGMRLMYDGVMVGRHTLNNDNPSLNIRMGVDDKGKVPYRIVVGNSSRLDYSAKLMTDDHLDKTIVVTSVEDDCAELIKRNIKFIKVELENEKLNINIALKELKSLGIQSILVEGGGFLLSEFLKANTFDRATIYIAPKILGQGQSYFNESFEKMKDALAFDNVELRLLGSQSVFEVKNVHGIS